jgi:DNA invertase Pin-like site-specific DNA recombinase
MIVGDFVDPGISANTIERPALKRLFESSNTWDLVIAWDFDRFYRDKRSVAGFILDRVDELRKQITSVKQPIPIYDPSTYEPRQNDTPYMLREMAGFTSGLDNRRRFRTLQKGLKERHRLGYATKPPPYGYQVAYGLQDGKPIALPRQIEPTEGAIVKRMFAEYLDGKSFLHIARDLNHSRIMSRSGQLWSGQTIRGIVMNPLTSTVASDKDLARNGLYILGSKNRSFRRKIGRRPRNYARGKRRNHGPLAHELSSLDC